MIKPIGFLLLIMSIISCKPGSHSRVMNQIDSLQLMLDSSEMALKSIDSAKVREMGITSGKNLKDANSNIKDSLKLEDGLLLSDYKYVHKAFDKYPEKNETFFEEIAFSKKQLTDLYSDLEKNLIDSAKAVEYYDGEEVAIHHINKNITAFVNIIKQKIIFFEENGLKIESLRDSLIRKNQ